jgi:hypothetical protein
MLERDLEPTRQPIRIVDIRRVRTLEFDNFERSITTNLYQVGHPTPLLTIIAIIAPPPSRVVNVERR